MLIAFLPEPFQSSSSSSLSSLDPQTLKFHESFQGICLQMPRLLVLAYMLHESQQCEKMQRKPIWRVQYTMCENQPKSLITFLTLKLHLELTPSDFRNQQACSVDFPKFLIFFDGYVGLPQGSLEPKNRRPKPHWSGAGAVSILGPIFTYINQNGVLWPPGALEGSHFGVPL